MHHLPGLSSFSAKPRLTRTSTTERSGTYNHGQYGCNNRSFISLRTFYAFGARSGQSPGLPRSLSCTSNDTLRQRSCTVFPQKPFMQRLSESASLYGASPSAPPSRDHPSLRAVPNPTTSRSPQIEKLRNTIYNDREMKLRERHEYLSATAATTSALPVGEVRRKQRIEEALRSGSAKTAVKAESVTPSEKENSEMKALVERNKFLENEVERLRLKLREQEHSEKELRKKLLECAAEVQVWKKRCEMQRASPLDIDEPKEDDGKIGDIIEQLSSAAEKLTRLNAVKDLKLLQNEMESALREISQ